MARERSTEKPVQREPRPRTARQDREDGPGVGNFPPESLAFMKARTEMFQRMRTSRMTHGTGKKEK